jgi:predicted Zn-dependent peptidase
MQQTTYDRIGETLYRETLDNGLSVVLLSKPGFQQTFATFTTHYGSIDRTFKLQGDADFMTVPDGIAHFLEHKMFESESGDVFPEFARQGASANAFTTFDMTTYLFSCTDNVKHNVLTLLDFVQDPYFTEQSVEKEKGIIGQEIRMYQDNPDWRAFFGLLKAMYQVHPLRVDIAGTIDSIAKIDQDTLYACYRTFYHPGNMVFFVVGDFDVAEMLEWIRENQASKEFGPLPVIERQFPDEPDGVNELRTITKLSVSQPRCLVGWKDKTETVAGSDLLRRELLTGVILDAVFGRGSTFYHQLIDEELIDSQFAWEYERTPSYGYSLVGGNTKNPDLLMQRIDETLAPIVKNGLNAEDFERCRKKAIGRFMSVLDSPGYLARNYVAYDIKDADMFKTIDLLQSLTIDEANQRMAAHFAAEQRAVSVVLPNQS